MYGENGTQMRTELAALLRQHRVMHRLETDSAAGRAEVGRQVLRFRQTILVWCTQAIGVARPLAFANVPVKPADPFRATSDHGAAVEELGRSLELARDESPTKPASSIEFTTPSPSALVEHWRLAARAAALAEHDTAPDRAVHLTAAQGRAVAGDVAAVSQALVVLDRRYRNTPHSFRRTVATEIDEVYDAEAAKNQLGHTSKTVTERHYINRKLVVPDYRAATERLAPGPGSGDGTGPAK